MEKIEINKIKKDKVYTYEEIKEIFEDEEKDNAK